MKVADAHCDTLTKFPDNPFHTELAHWNLEKFAKSHGVLQYFAIFTPDNFAGDSALRFAFESISNFIAKNNNDVIWLKSPSDYDENKTNVLLSLEGAAPIINNINNLYAFYELGIRAMGLTWNHRNFVADGIDTDFGLTPFGIEVIKEMERIKMIIDVSHLNENGFADVVKNTNKAFIASHSNARTIHDHRRNLHDDQIREIISRQGFIGLNFYTEFVAQNDFQIAFYKHIEHFLKLGAENVLGMGADFDGIPIGVYPDALSYVEIAEKLLNDMQLDRQLVEKIMHRNLIECTLRLI
ncbi:MAG: membrane dipeptidase [Desulfobulbaceae bacterium]|nr:membrane dipeptidase [Desulfobulbaceae bacterium]